MLSSRYNEWEADGGQRKLKRRGAVSGACACKQPPAGKSSWVREGHGAMGGGFR